MDDKWKNTIEERLKELESHIGSQKKVKKPREPRPLTEFQKFMSKELKEIKEAEGDKYDHKQAFSKVTKKWSELKSEKSTKTDA